MADAGGIQLLSESRKKIEYKVRRPSKLLVFSFAFVALILGLYGGLVYYKGKAEADLDKVKKGLVDNEESRSKTDEDKLLKLQAKLGVVGSLLAEHIVWSEGLQYFQNLVNPQVQVDSLQLKTAESTFFFKAYAASFAVVARQIAAFYADNAVTDVQIGRVSSSTTGQVEFSAIVKFNPDRVIRNNQ